MLENLAVVLIAPALPCPVRNQVSVEKPDWSTVPFIMADQGPVRRRIELWFRRNKISNPMIYATVGGHEAMVSMVALGCGVALLPEVVLENSPEPVRNRVRILERSDEKTPFELGVCAQKTVSYTLLLRVIAHSPSFFSVAGPISRFGVLTIRRNALSSSGLVSTRR